jgi:hypothetical protein
MSTLFRNLVAAVAATAVAIAVVPSAAAAATTSPQLAPTTHNAAPGAAGWLAQQLVHGNHLVYSFDGTTFDGGGTADAIYALAASKSGKSTIDHAIAYFQKNVETYVDIKNTDGFGPNDGGIGKTALAAMVAGVSATSFGGYNLLRQLKTDECSTASVTCPAAGAAANIYSSISESVVITAEARAGGKYRPSAPAVTYFLSLQCADGGFTTGTSGGSGCTPDVDATGYAVMALQALGGHAAQIKKAASWLVSKRSANGSWKSQGGANVDSTALAVVGLHIAGRPTAKSASWLRAQQMTSGPTTGTGASRGALKYQSKFDATASVKATSDGILGITRSSLATLKAAGAVKGRVVLALPTPQVAKATVLPGGAQRVLGAGFAAAERVIVTIGGKRLGRATSNKSGTATISFTVPKSFAAGKHTVVLIGQRSHLHSQTTFRTRTA